MKELLQIHSQILNDKDKVLSYSLILALWFSLIIASIVILRMDKLKLIFKFIILFFKEKGNEDNIKNL